ncbi:DUF4190 domain-containing protein [Amycolatopsis sp. FDAARGOS 1241]|uniref:DUF4190 domain-containing protein n=1 Tax=Amycolatopsis sp. FDAARGOS 1241 TaxID=2778070 RepID=UPI00194E1B6B|nr:DUF4190 domain-containing protein [Amycolatopsis sp. FDAARGOS 1241]QRP48045.1 DUF4190 domain-containing protein [Amycolatopsis sp. FDAARGOS 1241]
MPESILPPKPTGPSYQDAPPPPPQPKTNGFAIASLILAIPALSLMLSIVFGFVALVQTRRDGRPGKGLAIAGLSVSGAWLVVIAVSVAVTLSGSDSVFAVHKGDCFTTESSTTITRVACDQPHGDEVYAVIALPGGDAYPGEETLAALSRDYCTGEQDAFFVNTSPPTNLVMAVYYPHEAAWRGDDHSAVCTLESESGGLRNPVVH